MAFSKTTDEIIAVYKSKAKHAEFIAELEKEWGLASVSPADNPTEARGLASVSPSIY